MKFVIEIRTVDADGAETLSRSFNYTAINPSRAVKYARAMLVDWKKRYPGRYRIRMLNNKAEEIFSATE